jgi:hypothetical protein
MRLQHCHICRCVIVRTHDHSAACADCAWKMTRTQREAMAQTPAIGPFVMPYAEAIAKYPTPTSQR